MRGGSAQHVRMKPVALRASDAPLDVAQMLEGAPVGTLAIGKAGAAHGAPLAETTPALGDLEPQEHPPGDRRRKTRSALLEVS